MDKCKRVVPIILAVTILLVVAFILIGHSFQKLNSDEIGVEYDTIQRVLNDEAREEGLHVGPVGFKFIKFPSISISIKFEKLFCLNRDGVLMELIVSFQYRVRKSALFRVVMEFKDHERYETVLKVVAESAINEACSQFRTFEFPSERGKFTEKIKKTITDRFEPLNCEVTDVQVNNFQSPADYDEAVTQKERAREDIQVALNERPHQLTEARTSLRQAEFQANITIARAESSAQIMQTQALAEAASIRIQYEKEAETYAQVMSASGLNFTAEGFLSYLGIRVISDAHNPVYVGIKNPAKVTYNTEP